MNRLIILGKGDVCGKHMSSIKTKEDIPGYNNEDVWTVASHTIEDADGYLALHGETKHLDREIRFPDCAQYYAHVKLLLNNSISIMLLKAAVDCGYEHIRIAGCPLEVDSEYNEQRESLFMTIGFIRATRETRVEWDNDIEDYNNYYSQALGIKYL